MKNWLDDCPWSLAILLALSLGLAPFVPEAALSGKKLKMLAAGATLSEAVDIFDLAMHGLAWLLVIAKGRPRSVTRKV